MRYCKNCGLLAPFDAACCPQCGAPLPPAPAAPTADPAGQQAPGKARYHAPLQEAEEIPALSPWATLGALLLFAVPVAGFLFSLAWSFGFTKNPARRRLAQAYLIRTLLVAVVAALLLFWVAVSSVLTLSVTPYPYY